VVFWRFVLSVECRKSRRERDAFARVSVDIVILLSGLGLGVQCLDVGLRV